MSIKTAPEVFRKAPGENRKRNFNFGAELPDGDSIVGPPSISVTPTGLDVTYLQTSDSRVQCQFENGVAGQVYKVTCEITTDSPETIIGAGLVEVQDP